MAAIVKGPRLERIADQFTLSHSCLIDTLVKMAETVYKKYAYFEREYKKQS